MSRDIWLPESAREKGETDEKQVVPAGSLPHDETIPVVLCGGPYGETKETGKEVRVAKNAIERTVLIAKPKNRMIHTREGAVERLTFVPGPEPGVWRLKHGEEVPN